jgi:DHA1 family bicyclomycin/chloramphenicol resistance-like MFS transporter
MYLPAYGQVAADFGVPSAKIALTLSGYFIGLALGQGFYGPLLDRFGRLKPLYAGLCLYIIASAGCALAPSFDLLVAMRFIQGFGGCVAGIASLAMVHDFFPVEDRARVLSRLFLFISASPLLAPTIGGSVAIAIGWKAVFAILACVVVIVIALMVLYMPEGHVPDTTISLAPGPILREYGAILKHPRFITYALAGAFSFAGLFTYVAGSPIVFMDGFHLTPVQYSGVFAFLAVGFIGGSQVNVALLRKFGSELLFLRVVVLQVIIGAIFVTGTYFGWYGLASTIALFFLSLSCTGITYPNAAALALAPFNRNAGSASAMLGFVQLGVGAVISTFIGISPSKSSLPIIAIMGITGLLGLIVLMAGRKRANSYPTTE